MHSLADALVFLLVATSLGQAFGKANVEQEEPLPRRSGEAFQCDVDRESRATIALKALEILKMNDFTVVKPGIFAGHRPSNGEQVGGNPNTLYMLAAFNDTDRLLTPPDYPPAEWPFDPSSDHGPSPPPGPVSDQLMGVSIQRGEAIVLLFCTPPPAKYFGLTSYVTNRVLFNDTEGGRGDASLVVHMPLAEISNPLNYLVMNTTKGTATAARKVDPSSFFNSLSLAVFSPSREVYQTITEAFVQAGLAESASNFYPLSAQTIRLHDRSKPFEWNYPDRLSVLCRVSYFEDKAAADAWASHPWPAFFIKAPDLPHYQRSVPEQRLLSDISGESEQTYLPTIHSLLAAIIANKTASGQARLLRQEQIVAVPNDRGTRNQCLNNNSFIAAVDPLMMAGGCGFGTTDCRYGTSAALDQPFGLDKFFIVVGVQHERLGHSSYSSIMLTSQLGYEEINHTITIRETDGREAPALYLSEHDYPDLNVLYSVTFARTCPQDDGFCKEFSEEQFRGEDIIYWMERAYLQRATGVSPNIDEYVQSFVLTFQGTLD
ncbi:hypothetical protein NSK_002941 [Nannochloropsis salina CCMP1776]|uniref:Uncharacterized protein n=1 Tax=Nannochloropsis salina CCMP1776 TaxID=1027361 RepID=A0A4D9D313_9STRA|nr:hypothetical protein NSK_002941 [Nannochloropsis salina CCMP1776]|eukprot:TFJ86121.1 hypothetical protein NSK_002941 [Nannochloropsis salina CCMP1776]